MVALPGGTTASARLWLLAFPDGMPASSRIEEPSAVMKASRCSRRTMSIETMLKARRAGPSARPARFGLLHQDVVHEHVARIGRIAVVVHVEPQDNGLCGVWRHVERLLCPDARVRADVHHGGKGAAGRVPDLHLLLVVA